MSLLVLLFLLAGAGGVPEPIAAFLLVGTALVVLFVHVAFAVGVYADAHRLPGDRTDLVLPATWALATLIGGVFVAGLYWIVHRSTLRPQPPVRIASAGTPAG